MANMLPFLKKNPPAQPSAASALPVIEPIGADVDTRPFRVTDPHYIAMALQALADDGDLVCLHPSAGEPSLPGRITEVRPQAGQFVVEIEVKGARAPQPQPGSVLLVAMPLGIALQLRTSGHWADTLPGAPLQLVAALPDHIIHLQRRRFPRLETPLGQPFRAEFMLYGETFSMGVDDVSIGGLGLRASAHEGRLLMPSQQLRRVRVELGHGATPLVVDLEVRSRRAFRSFLAGEQLHFGCRFLDLTPADHGELQLRLDRLDAERTRAAPPRLG